MFTIYTPGLGRYSGPDLEPDLMSDLTPARYVLPVVPEPVLQRHGARVLRPAQAAVVRGQERPDPTVYRYGVLLLPTAAMDADIAGLLNDELADVGMTVDVPGDVSGPTELVSAELRPADLFRPEAVDAWTALQRLRAGAERMISEAETDEERDVARTFAGVVAEITLEHLLYGSALEGVGSSPITGTNTASNGSPDVSDLFSRPQPGTSGRIPVTVVLPDPGRPPVGATARRRPVVAVLDTGVADPPHPWLPTAERGTPEAQNAVVVVNAALQQGLEQHAPGNNGIPATPIVGYADRPSIEEPLLGYLSTHAGHGTFIAGIIRQLAPGAQIYAVRVMHPDGFAHEADVIRALERIADGVRRAHQGDPGGQFVDVVSLSLGYFHESPLEQEVTTRLQPVLEDLVRLGVAVVAAAGNFATGREFYPAALTTRFRHGAGAPLISVGALNPNQSTARYSNEGSWVTCYASGTAVVSTFPAFAGALNPVAATGGRQTFDPDDFRGGYGVWSGTSFAVPGIAACLAGQLHDRAGAFDGDTEDARTARQDAARDAWRRVLEDRRFWPRDRLS